MSAMGSFRKRMAATGGDLRDERVTAFQRQLAESWRDDPSYEPDGVLLYGSDPLVTLYPRVFERKDPVVSTPSIQFQTLINESFACGDVFTFSDGGQWMCSYKPNTHGLYHQGTIVYCNYVMRFVSPITGDAIEWPAALMNATQYNSGETGGQQLTFGSSQHIVLISLNAHTVPLDHGFRFLIDRNPVHPTAYKITQVDPTNNYKGKSGVLRWIVVEDPLRADDDLQNGIAAQDSRSQSDDEGWFR